MAKSALQLHAEMVAALHERTGLCPALAAPFIDAIMDHLQARYGGERLYIPTRPRAYPLDAMRRALQDGESYNKVAKRHGVSRATLYELIPAQAPQVSPGGAA